MDDVLKPGTLAGGYRIERLLRRGGMGAVYASIHPVIGKRAAVKVIDARIVALSDGTEPFVEEARLVNQIGHPNIVDVFGFDALPDGRPILMMELLEGENLRELLTRRRRLPPRDAVALILPVLDALGAAHRAGIVHRDLKPENVFLVRTIDERVAVKVLDFGVAKLIEVAQTFGTFTGFGTPAGTPAYMAPEQCRGDGVDARSDLYAVGLMLFEMLAGRGPLPGGSPAEYIGQQLYAEPARLTDYVAIDPALEDVVARLLSKDRTRRPQSAEVLAASLSAIVPASMATAGRTMLSVPMSEDEDPGRLPTATIDVPLGTPFVSTPSGMSGLGDSEGGAAGENRLVTVLFADVQGFTGLSEKMPPEEVRELIDRTFRELTAVVERFGGRVDKYIGDCVMAVFGVPRSGDHDAERAVEASLAMQAALEQLSHRARRPGELPRGISLRIGVNTGRVFAGTVGGENRRDFTVIGDAVNVAARLQSAAPKGAVVIGSETWRHVRGRFTAQRLEPLKAKGRVEPVEWFRVFGIAAEGGDPESHRFYGALTRFFAREDELLAILRAYDRAARTGHVQLVSVIGSAGTGKSRLRAQLALRLRELYPEAFVLQGRPSHRGTQAPYELVASFFRSRFPETANDDPEAVDAWIGQVQAWARGLAGLPESGPASPDWDDEPTATGILPMDPGARLDARVADLAGVLGLSFRSRTSPAPTEDLMGVRDRISASVSGLLGLALDHGPVVVLADDLDHADEASLDLLEDMLVHLQERPLVVVGFAGPELLDRRPRLGREGDDRTRIDLAALPTRTMEAIARDVLAGARGLSRGFLARLVERADGSPLVLKEIIRVLIEAGGIGRDPDGALRVHPGRVDAIELPSTIYGIVQARLDRLAPEERMLLMRAAVVGRTFWEGALLELVGGGEAAAAEVRLILDRLRSRDLIRAHEGSRFSGDREFVFKEATTRDVAYEALSQRMRQHHHRAVARWLTNLGEAVAERNPAFLALHHDRGGEGAAAVRFWTRAGHQAAGLGRHEEALAHYERAREIVDESKNTEPDDGGTVEDLRVASWEDRAQLRIHLGDTYRQVGRLPEAEAVYQEAMGEILREERRVGHSFDPERVRYYDALVELRLGVLEKVRGAYDEALGCYEAALDRIGPAGDPILRASVFTEIAWAKSRLDDHDGCLRACCAGLWAVRRADSAASQTVSCQSRLHLATGAVYHLRGDTLRARRELHRALHRAEAGGDMYQAGRAYERLGLLALDEGDLSAATTLLERALGLEERLGDLHDIAGARERLAEVALRRGDTAAAEAHLARAIAIAGGLDAKALQAEAYGKLAEVRLAQSRPLEALDAADRALDMAQAPGGRAHLGRVAVVYARCCVAAAAGPIPPEAEARIDRALIRARGHLLDVLTEAGLSNEAALCSDIVGAFDLDAADRSAAGT